MSLQDNTNKLNDILLTISQLDLSSLDNKPTEGIVYGIDTTTQSAYVSGYVGTEPNVYIASKYNNYPVTFIKENAFKDNSVIQSITMPNSIVTIGSQAFYNCENLVTVNFGDGLKEIGNQAFFSCPKIRKLKFPDGLEIIQEYAFYNCACLSIIELGENIQSIGDGAFYNTLLSRIFISAINPPTIYSNTFIKGTEVVSLLLMKFIFVPVDSVEIYNANTSWKDTGVIAGFNFKIEDLSSST